MYDDQDFEQEHSLFDRVLPVAGVLVILLVLGLGGYWVVGSMSGEGMPPKPEIQEISLVKPPPPPPPPPEVEEPPEQEIEEEEVEVPEPEEVVEELPDEISDEPPPGTELGLDAEGGAGGDAFGLIGKKGGRGLTSGGGYGWFAQVLQQDIQTHLSEVDAIRKASYTVVLRLWLAEDGSVETTVLERGTGNPEIDLALKGALSNGFRLSERPPEGLPQPIRLRVTSRT